MRGVARKMEDAAKPGDLAAVRELLPGGTQNSDGSRKPSERVWHERNATDAIVNEDENTIC